MDQDVLQRHRVRVSSCGERVLLFAQGSCFDHRAWRRAAPAFEDTHRMVVLFDHAGCSAVAAQSLDETHPRL